jgi:hypothetical protein
VKSSRLSSWYDSAVDLIRLIRAGGHGPRGILRPLVLPQPQSAPMDLRRAYEYLSVGQSGRAGTVERGNASVRENVCGYNQFRGQHGTNARGASSRSPGASFVGPSGWGLSPGPVNELVPAYIHHEKLSHFHRETLQHTLVVTDGDCLLLLQTQGVTSSGHARQCSATFCFNFALDRQASLNMTLSRLISEFALSHQRRHAHSIGSTVLTK